MRILLASDKFKGSLAAPAVADALRTGLAEVFPGAEFDTCPIADGGEGTTEAMVGALGGEWAEATVTDAQGRSRVARFGLVPAERRAILEMSAASGLAERALAAAVPGERPAGDGLPLAGQPLDPDDLEGKKVRITTRQWTGDDGRVNVASADGASAQKAISIIQELTATPELNKTYLGKVQRITDFGAFVEIMPGTDGLLHVSEIANHRVKDVRDELKEGQQILVKVIAIDPTGKIRLSRKALLTDEAPKAADAVPDTKA